MSWIRWQGLIGFVLILGIALSLWLLLTGPLLKHSIEKYGTDIVGAKVELKSARLSFEPVGVKLENFQVTNANKPMSNLLEFKRAEVSVDFLKILMGQVVINDLALEGIQFSIPRKNSGAIKKEKNKVSNADKGVSQKTSADKAIVTSKKNKILSIDEILEKEPLLTLQRKAELELAYKEEKALLNTAIKQLPEKNALKVYEQGIKKLTEDDIESLEDALARKEELDKTKAEITQDKKAIQFASRQIKQSKKRLKHQLNLLKKAPAEDLKNIKNKYNLSDDDAINLSTLLVGNQAEEWSGMAMQAYDIAESFIGKSGQVKGNAESEKIRAEGRFISFPTRDPIPDFLIRKASLEVILDTKAVKGTLSGELKDFTPQPEILRRPAKLELLGTELRGMDHVMVQGVFNHTDPLHPIDSIEFNVESLFLENKQMVDSGKLELNMASSIIDIQGKAVVENSVLNSKINSRIFETRFTGQGKDSWARELVVLLDKIESFDVEVLLSGQIKDFDIGVSSDLDDQLKVAMKSRVAEKKLEMEAKLMSRLNEKISTLPNISDSNFNSMNEQQAQLKYDLNHADELLKAQISDFEDQEKKKLEDKKDKKIDQLKGKFIKKFKF